MDKRTNHLTGVPMDNSKKILENIFKYKKILLSTALPITVGDPHHNKKEDEGEEEDAGDAVDDGGSYRVGDRGFSHCYHDT